MSNTGSLPAKGRKGPAKKKSTLNEKAVFIWQALVGTKVVVVLSNGVQYQGKNMSLCLKEVRRLNPPNHMQARIVPQLVIDGDDVLYVTADEVDLEFDDVKSDGFKTDTAISGHSGEIKERELEKWQAEEAFSPNMTLGKQTRWDQFETNERLFGVDTDFNEEDYTTKLDRSDPSFKEKEAKAIKLAREIETATSTNIHVAEERGQAINDKHLDEESRYSSVLLKEGNSKNTPPISRKSQEFKKGSNKPPGMAQTWSQVAKKSNDVETPKVLPESPEVGENLESTSLEAKRTPARSRVSTSSKNSESSQSNPKAAMKVDHKSNTSGRVVRPVERQQFRDQITTATADRKVSQRIIQKEAFKSFSEEINTKLPKIIAPSSVSTSNTASIEHKKVVPESMDSTKSQENNKPNDIIQTKAKIVDDSDKVSETDSVSTATTATRKFKLNVDAAEFTPSGTYAPPSSSFQKRKGGGSFPKRNPQTSKNTNRSSYYQNEDPGDVPLPFMYMPGYPAMPGSPFVPGMPAGSPTDSAPSFGPMFGSGFVPPPGGMFIPPSGGYPGMIPYQIGPMMVPNWMPYQVDENGNPIDPSYTEGYYEETDQAFEEGNI